MPWYAKWVGIISGISFWFLFAFSGYDLINMTSPLVENYTQSLLLRNDLTRKTGEI